MDYSSHHGLYKLVRTIVHVGAIYIYSICSSLPFILFYLVIFVHIPNTVMVSEGDETVVVCVSLSMMGDDTRREFMVNLTTSDGTAMCKCIISYFCVKILCSFFSLSS